ncbi:MAG: hypothetical protein V7L11_16640 [Nostoc sp.]|uniref:hypothetical protein n=1 Tax=Nostoc sp. TaxID=1180 RepID=UPI002FF684C1
MYSASQTAELTLELFHFQTSTSLQFPANLSVICIGKLNDQKPPDIVVGLAIANSQFQPDSLASHLQM